MTALQGISQNAYVTPTNDTLICYTFGEQREIARIFLQEEECQEKVIILEKQLRSLDTAIYHQMEALKYTSILCETQKATIENLYDRMESNKAEIEKLERKNKNKKVWLTGSVVLNVILGALLFI